jgi:hypothetical protein
MATQIKVVLFEDSAQTQSQILAALAKYAGKGEILPFDGSKSGESENDKKLMYEDRLERILLQPPYDGTTLFFADRDLSKSLHFVGMSVSAVTGAAKRLGIPVCSYARQPAPEEYKWRARWEEGHIVLMSGTDEELARQAILAANGFAEIEAKLPQILKEMEIRSPAKILAALLDRPEESDKIALYSVGDQSRLSDIPTKAKHDADPVKRIACFLGYWLWDSILRYPGLLVNEVAAASHLNIAAEDFKKPEVRTVFEPALYGGPFADSMKPQWWRGILDDIVSRANSNDGLELVRKNLGDKIRPSQCWVDPSRPAGYYCIISEQAVSLERSKGGLSWFPRGADLTRISTPLFEEYGPWIGA